jgi:hypothetical protein
MGPDRTTWVETLVTWLGLWGAMRGGSALVAAVVAAVGLLEILAPAVFRLFPGASRNAIHFMAVGLGLLLGLIAHFTAEFWDRVAFEALYGPEGRWRDRNGPVLLLFPGGHALRRSRELALQVMPRRSGADSDIRQEAVKIARRQAERWERIERPLILSQVVRGFLWPGVYVGILACGAALASRFLGAAAEAPRLLAGGAAAFAVLLVFLVPYTRLRTEYLVRLYEDVAAHGRKKKSERH